jgi:vacuolar-type H+-ATPase subunit H
MIENDIIMVKKAENDALELVKKTMEFKNEQIVNAQQENEKYIRRREDEAFHAVSTLKEESLKSAGKDAERLLHIAEKESEKIRKVRGSNIARSVNVIVSKITGVEDVFPFRDEPYHDRPP